MFHVDLSPHIIKVSPIRCFFPPVENSDGSDHMYVTYRPGAPGWDDVTFTFMGHDQSLSLVEDWVKTNYEGKAARKNITITIRDQQQQDVRQYNLMNCLPIHYTKVDLGASGAGNQTVVKLKLTCKVNEITCS